MATLEENMLAKTPLGSALYAGVNTISIDQTLTFDLYERKISPIDGMAYWVNASLIQQSKGLVNSVEYNETLYNEGVKFDNTAQPLSIQVKGSLHFSTQMNQLEDRTTAHNHMIFTSTEFIQAFNAVEPHQQYICTYPSEKGLQKFGFSERMPFYQQAGLYHYRGNSLYATISTQIIENLEDLDLATQTVSNSLPIWLSLQKDIRIVPAYLVPQNLLPPIIIVYIDPSKVTALAQTTFINQISSSYQLTKDTVRISMYGLSNNQAIDFVNYINQYTLDNDSVMGLMNMPILQDQHVTQPEFNIIAKKKEVIFEVNYYQSRVQDITRQLILEAFCSVNINELPN
jgi:hypothetical protein